MRQKGVVRVAWVSHATNQHAVTPSARQPTAAKGHDQSRPMPIPAQ